MQFKPAIPIFRSFDEAKARAHYVEYLGFSWDGNHRFDETAQLYAFLTLGDFKLHLSEHYGDATPGSNAIAEVSDINEFHDSLTAKTYAFANPHIEILPWAKQIQIADPFGNRIRFIEPTSF